MKASIAFPLGHFNALHILGTRVYGSKTAQTVTIRYADSSVSTFTQSLSDWFSPQHFAREFEGVQMPITTPATAPKATALSTCMNTASPSIPKKSSIA